MDLFEPKPDAAAQGVACCDVVNRGAGLRQRQDLLQHARQPHRRGRRQDRQGDLAHQARRHQPRRDHDHGAAGGEGQGAGRQQRRRDRRARLAHRARREHRQDRLARLLDRARRGRADRRRFQAVLRLDEGQGPRRQDLAGRPLADRRRHGLGLDLVRPGAQPDLLRHRQSRALERQPAARRQSLDHDDLRPRSRHRRGEMGLPDSTRTTCGTTTRSTRTCCSTSTIDGKPRKVLVHPAATATCTSSTAPPARCCRPTPTTRSTRTRASISRPAGSSRTRRRQPIVGKTDREHLPGRARRQGLAADRLVAAHQAPLRAASAPLHELQGIGGRLHRRHALRRAPRSTCMPGPGGYRGEFMAWDPVAAQEGLGDQGEASGLERQRW